MYKTKKDVDAYARSESSKILSATEFHLLNFTIAKLYYEINEFATAQQYLCCCLNIKEDNDQAHKLLGQCYQYLKNPDKALQSFQRSLQLNPKQSDILAEVCQLLLEDKNLNANEAKYWCELAESEEVQHEAVFSLRLKLMNKENLGTNQVEELIQKEIAARPNDVQLRVKLVRNYVENNQILDAFTYVHQLEMSQMDAFVTSSEWYNVFWLVLNKYEQMPNTKKDWDFWLLLAICLERQIQISFSLPSKPTTIGGGVTETENLLLNLDQYLFKISQLSDKFCAQRELVELFLDHYRGQLLLHATVLIFKRGRFHNKSQWKETTRAVLPLLLLAYRIGASNNKAPWMKHCDKQSKQLITLWQREGSFRCAQAGRTLLSCVDDNGVDKENAHNINNLLGSQSSGLWQSNDELLNQVRQTCSDRQWRRNIFALLFCNSDQKVKEQSSLFAKSSKLSEPIYEMPSYADVERYEDTAQYLRPQSLQHMVYLCLGNENLAYIKAKYFNGLNYSTQNLSFCGAESLDQLDVDSFLYAATIQAKRALEVDSSALGKPKLLPFVNIQNLLCTKEQSRWWNAAYIVYKNLSSGNDLAELRANLQYGIEAVRGINGPKLDMAIVLKLGQIFVARAQESAKPIEKAYLEARAESIYKYGLNMMKMPNEGVLEPFRKYFKYVKSQTPVAECALVSAAEDAVSYLATRYFKRSEYEDLIAELSGIQLPFATYLQAEAYHKLCEISKTPKKSKRLYLNHAIVCLNQTLALFKSSNNANSNHLLHSLIHSEIKRLQQTSARYSNDSNTNFSPITGHNDSSTYDDAETDFYSENSIMPPTSMVNTIRSERDTLSANAILSSHNQEIETPVKQVVNTLTIFNDEIINNLKLELQNISREIRTLKDKISSFEEAWYQKRQQTSPPPYMGVSQSRNNDGTITNGLDMISNSPFMSQRQCLQAMLPQANVVITNSDLLSNPKPTTNFVTSAPVQKSDDTSGSQVFVQPSSTPLNTVPASKSLFSGLNLSTKVSTSNDNSGKSTTVTTTSAWSFANFTFGKSTAPSSLSTTLTTTASSTVASKTGATITSTTSSFASIFSNLSSSPFINPTSNASTVSVIPTTVNETATGSALNKSSTSDTEGDYVPTAQLNPVIPLPDFVKVNTGEENEIVLFFHRAKLFRFDKEAGEWKERGLGIIKLLQNSDDLNKVRLVMRREQIHKLCCNQRIYKYTAFKYTKNSQTALSWEGQDFSENELVTEMSTVRFKLPETCKQFLEIIQDAQAKMTSKGEEVNSKASEKKNNPAECKPTKGFGDAFKPKAGSWSCNTCYITNDAGQLYCVACDTSKDDTVPKKKVTSNILAPSSNTKFSFGFSAASFSSTISAPTQSQSSIVEPSFGFITPTTTSTAVSSELNEKMSSTKPPATGGFGNAFKPKAGSWSCNTCYIPNDADQLYCVACDTPKDDTAPKKEATSNILAPSSNTKFDFKFSAASSLVTLPAATQSQSSTTKPSFEFITSPAILTSLLTESNKKISSTKHPASDRFGDVFKTKTDCWTCQGCHLTNSADALYCKACYASKDDTALSNSTEKFYFGPLYSDATLPVVVDKSAKPFKFFSSTTSTTLNLSSIMKGEEVMFYHSSRLLHVKDMIWKDHSIGDVAILKSSDGFSRILIRRDQNLNICAYHKITHELTLTVPKKETKGFIWTANDFAEGSLQLKKFYVCFKLLTNAQTFQTAFKKAQREAKNIQSAMSANNVEKSKEILNKGIPFALTKSTATNLMTSTAAPKNEYSLGSQPQKVFGESIFAATASAPSVTASSSKSLFSDLNLSTNISSSNVNSAKSRAVTTTAASPFASFTFRNWSELSGISSTFASISTQFAKNLKKLRKEAVEKQSAMLVKNEEKSKVTPKRKSNTGRHSALAESKATNLVTSTPAPKNEYSFGFQPQKVFGQSIFAATATAPSTTASSSKSLFSDLNLSSEISSSNVTSAKSRAVTTTAASPFVNFNFGNWSTNTNTNTNLTPKSNEKSGFIGLTNQNDFSSFGKPLKEFNSLDKNSSASKINESQKNVDGGGEGAGDGNDENYNPHYVPVIELPNKVIFSTPEEEETKLFGERAFLFRWDATNKEIKESGVGELKILLHPAKRNYRLVMRCVQIHKLVLNNAINADFHFDNMNNNPKSFVWETPNYAESNEGELEKLAVRFCKLEIAEAFSKKLRECIDNCKEWEKTN